MKNLLIASLLVVSFALGNVLHAQDLKKYSPLLHTLSKPERIQFLITLKTLTSATQVGNQRQDSIFNELKKGLPVSNPTAGIDSILQAWSLVRRELNGLLLKAPDEFSAKDVEAILGAYDLGNAAWIENLNEIQNGFTQYKDSLKVDAALVTEAETKYEASTVEMQDALNKQYQEFYSAMLVGNTGNGKIAWDKAVDNLLNDFGALEIGAGVQSLYASYYEEAPDSTSAILVRFGSAPDYNKLWGAEWNVWASFKEQHEDAEILTPATLGIKTFLAGGNVSFQYRPTVPFTQGVMRLITGVGINVGAYIPARINPTKPTSFDNRGKTTGMGPEVRLGFAVNTGKIGFYAYSNRSTGYVLRVTDFPYSNWQVVSGIQWEALHLRFLHGETSWAEAGSRQARYNEVSISVRIK